MVTFGAGPTGADVDLAFGLIKPAAIMARPSRVGLSKTKKVSIAKLR
jgi:hypothetical protein